MSLYVVRHAKAADMSAVCELIQEMSDLENTSEKAQLTVDDLLRDGGFDNTSPAFFNCFVAEQLAPVADKIVGYALVFFMTLTDKRKSLQVDSLHVNASIAESLRAAIRRDLGAIVCTFGRKNGCFNVQFHLSPNDRVLLPMWKELGGADLNQREGSLLRLHVNEMNTMIGTK